MTEQFDGFTERARNALHRAKKQARGMQHSSITTEHILLGLVEEPRGVLRQVLDTLGIELEVAHPISLHRIRRAALKRLESVERSEDVPEQIPFAPEAKQALSLAVEEVNELGADYVSPTFLLLGLIREGSGVTAESPLCHFLPLDDVRSMYRQALRALGGAAERSGIDEWQAVRLVAPLEGRLLIGPFEREFGEEATGIVSQLVQALKDSDFVTRFCAAQALGDMGHEAKSAAPALVDALKDEWSFVRGHVLAALWRIDPESERTVKVLTEALSDGDDDVRKRAAFGLGEIARRTPDVVEALRGMGKDDSDKVRYAASEALRKLQAAK